jgi:hypothetical protein
MCSTDTVIASIIVHCRYPGKCSMSSIFMSFNYLFVKFEAKENCSLLQSGLNYIIMKEIILLGNKKLMII